jgi:DNA-directed RNA polymerase subunit RPC12/RpoP
MRRMAVVLALGLGLVSYGCAGHGTAARDASGKPITKETQVRCPKCGADFTVGEGLGPTGKTP